MLCTDKILNISFLFPYINHSFGIHVLFEKFLLSLQSLLSKAFIFIQESYSLIEAELDDLLLSVFLRIFPIYCFYGIFLRAIKTSEKLKEK